MPFIIWLTSYLPIITTDQVDCGKPVLGNPQAPPLRPLRHGARVIRRTRGRWSWWSTGHFGLHRPCDKFDFGQEVCVGIMFFVMIYWQYGWLGISGTVWRTDSIVKPKMLEMWFQNGLD